MLGHILGGSRSSRLHQALREQARLVSGISGWYGALQGAGALGVTAQLEAGTRSRSSAASWRRSGGSRPDGVTPEELARAITAAEAQRVFSRETVEGLALAYGRAETIWTLEAERAYLDRRAGGDGRARAGGGAPLPHRRLRAAGLRPAGPGAVSPRRAAALALAAGPRGGAGGGAGGRRSRFASSSPAASPCWCGRTPRPRWRRPRSSCGWARAGRPRTTRASAICSSRCCSRGPTKRSALEIAETAESLGGGIGASADLDYSEIRATALARNWRSDARADRRRRAAAHAARGRDRRRAPRHPDRAPQPPGPAVLAGHGHADEPRLRGSPVRPPDPGPARRAGAHRSRPPARASPALLPGPAHDPGGERRRRTRAT